jgi:hypothetical protein
MSRQVELMRAVAFLDDACVPVRASPINSTGMQNATAFRLHNRYCAFTDRDRFNSSFHSLDFTSRSPAFSIFLFTFF